MVVAAAGWMNLPKRVPVLAKPQEGSSTERWSSALKIISVDLSFIAKAPVMRGAKRCRPKGRRYNGSAEAGPFVSQGELKPGTTNGSDASLKTGATTAGTR